MKETRKNNINFSDYVESYQEEIQSSINFIGQNVDFFIELKANLIKKIAGKYFEKPQELMVLDIGCGIGLTDHHLAEYFSNLHGVDIEKDVIDKAKQYNPSVMYGLYNGTEIPFDSCSMDLVFAINVIHHVQPAGWSKFTDEMFRVTKKGGIALVFEHNPFNPLTRLAVSRCEFDKDAVLLYKNRVKSLFADSNFRIQEHSYIVFFPFNKKLFRSIETALRWLPLGAQYLVAGKK